MRKAIVTGGTRNFFPAMAVLALNIADKCPDIADELVIYHDGVSRSQQKKIQKIFPTRFIRYKSPFTKIKNFSDEIRNHFSPMVFCKFECFKLLNEYDTVIWTDYDVLIKKDLSILLKEYPSTTFVKSGTLATAFTNVDTLKKEYPDLDFDSGWQFFGGFFVLRKDFIGFNDFYEKCIEETAKLGRYLNFGEQGVFSVLLHRSRNTFAWFDEKLLLAVHPKDELKYPAEDIYILHAYGVVKFWSGINNPDWNNYYKTWMEEYGGKPFEQRQIAALKRLAKNCLRITTKIRSAFSNGYTSEGYKNTFIQMYGNPNFWPTGEYNFSNMDLSRHSYGVLNLKYINDGILKIGQCVSIAEDVVFMLGGEHPLETLSTFPFDVYYSENIKKNSSSPALSKHDNAKRYSITIEDDVWIGMRATVLSGVTIHQGAVIGACSVVTKDVPPYAIVAGNPARVIRYRFSQEIIEKLLRYVDYSKLTDKKVQDNLQLLIHTSLTDENIDSFIKIFE